MREDENFDRLIDAALGAYGEADPGLERRVLARIAAKRATSPRFGRMAWAVTLAAAAGLLLTMVLMRPRPAHAPAASARIAPALQQAPKEMARVEQHGGQRTGEARRLAHPRRATGRSIAVALPKQEVFPTPRPLSPEEQALVDFAARATVAERRSFVEAQAQPQPDKPISIAVIHIAPIEIRPLDSPQPGAN